MAPTKPQKLDRVVDAGDDRDFVNKQKDLFRQVKARRDEARTKIPKNRTKRQKDLQTRIKALKRSASIKQPGSGADAPNPDQKAFGTLRDLLARKKDIERRIAQSIESLERAMHTTSREFQVVLTSRTELHATATAGTSKSSTALIVKP